MKQVVLSAESLAMLDSWLSQEFHKRVHLSPIAENDRLLTVVRIAHELGFEAKRDEMISDLAAEQNALPVDIYCEKVKAQLPLY